MKELRIALRDFEKYKEKNKDDLYGISCYKVALKLMKAFDKEMEKRKHSGLAVGFIKSLIKSWLSENSISPIEDDDFKKCDTLQFGVEVYYFDGIFNCYLDKNSPTLLGGEMNCTQKLLQILI